MNRPTACTYLLYVVLDQYYLYSPSRFTDSRGGKPSRFTDSRGGLNRRVSPMENSRIHSLFVENSQAMRPGR